MQDCRDIISVQVKASFFYLIASCILFLPIRMFSAWFCAALVHEYAHCVALHFCRVRILGITIGATGAKLDTESMSIRKELICTLAGPIGGFSLLFFFQKFPLIAFFGAIQSVVNLIPIQGRDGGRALQCLLIRIVGDARGSHIFFIISRIVRLLVLLLLVVFLKSLNFIATVLLLVVFIERAKIPCKRGRQIVQYRQQIPKR